MNSRLFGVLFTASIALSVATATAEARPWAGAIIGGGCGLIYAVGVFVGRLDRDRCF